MDPFIHSFIHYNGVLVIDFRCFVFDGRLRLLLLVLRLLQEKFKIIEIMYRSHYLILLFRSNIILFVFVNSNFTIESIGNFAVCRCTLVNRVNRYAVYSVHYTLYNVHYTLYSVHCKLFMVLFCDQYLSK